MANLYNLDNKFIVEDSGDVGIGVTTATTKLHIGGTAPGDSIIRQDSTVSGTNWEIGERAAGKWQIFEDDGDTIVATFMSSGNVGIGTTSPTQSKLVVIDSADTSKQIVFSDNATYYGSISHNAGTGLNEYRTEATGGHAFYKGTETTPKLTIDSSGRVGIGVTPSYANVPLHTKNIGGGDSYNIFEGIGNAWVFGEVDQTGTKYCQVGGRYGAHSGINIDTVGNVGIGTNLASAKLEVTGTTTKLLSLTQTRTETSTSLATMRSFYAFGITQFRGGVDKGLYMSNITNNIPGIQVVDSSNNAGSLSIQPYGGNVGIGTTSPQQLLHINKAGDTTKPGIQVQGGSFGFTLGKAPQSADYVHLRPLGSGISVLRVMPNTSSSTSYIEAWGTDYEADSSNWNRILMNVTGSSGNATIATESNGTGAVGNLYLGTNSNQQALTILNSGNVGIGTTSPRVVGSGYKGLEVSSTSSGSSLWLSGFSDTTKGYLAMDTGGLNLTAISNHSLTFGTNNSPKMTIASGGKTLIGLTAEQNAGHLQMQSGTSENGGILDIAGGGWYRYYTRVCRNSTSAQAAGYWHIKTNIVVNSNTMFMAKFYGYIYGSAQILELTHAGYAYSGSNTVINQATTNNGNNVNANSVIYSSSNGNKVTFRIAFGTSNNFSTYFAGVMMDMAFPSPAGQGHDFEIEAQSFSTSGFLY